MGASSISFTGGDRPVGLWFRGFGAAAIRARMKPIPAVPDDLDVAWRDDAVIVTLHSTLERTWTLDAVVLETFLLWIGSAAIWGLPMAFLGIIGDLSAGSFLVSCLVLYGGMAVAWFTWQFWTRASRVQICIDRDKVTIHRHWHVLRRHIAFVHGDLKRIDVDLETRALRVEFRRRPRLLIPLVCASPAHLRWIASTVEHASDANTRFWREQIVQDADARRAVQRLVDQAGRE